MELKRRGTIMKNTYIYIIGLFFLYQNAVYAHGVHNDQLAQNKSNVTTYDNAPAKVSIADHLDLFQKDVGITGPVPCKLHGNDGTLYDTSCYEVTVYPIVENHAMGPWCPKHIDDPEMGYWFTDPEHFFPVDGAFFNDINPDNKDWWVWNLMVEQSWDKKYGWSKENNSFLESDKMTIKTPKTGDACLAEIFPKNSMDLYQAYVCQECLPLNNKDWYSSDNTNKNKYVFFNEDGTKKALGTRLIPAKPQIGTAAEPYHLGLNIGITFSGIIFEGAAPIDKRGGILDVKTIVPFDACGGHVNPQGGYHYHQAKHCYPIMQESTSHTGLVGFAWDGFPLYDFEVGIAGLDECNGHIDAIRGYHYHLAQPGSNHFIGCYKAMPEAGAVALHP